MKLVLMERGLWGFRQEGQETPPAETATTALKMLFDCHLTKPIQGLVIASLN